MNKEFVTYEQSLALKELGFDEPCFGYYYTLNGKDWNFAEKTEYLRLDDEMNIGGKFTIPAPLYQQVFRWFRVNHDLTSWVYVSDVNKYFCTIMKSGRYIIEHKVYPTYEEAEQACLNKLIELI